MSDQGEQRELAQASAHSPEAGGRLPLEEAVHCATSDELLKVAADPALTAGLALALLRRADLPGDALEQLGKNRSLLKHRKVKIALVLHPRTPRHVSVPLIRQFYTFDLMKVALQPTAPADVKRTADEVLIARLGTVTLGERLTLARRGPGRTAGALLSDSEERIMRTALENARLTEVFVARAVLQPEAGAALIQAVAQHPKWSYRRDVQLALLRTEYLSLAKALAFAREIPPAELSEILQNSRLPKKIKRQLLGETNRSRLT
ncbi:MAG: hypothetical protein WAL71_17440 [Terriglobales bacterium]|jgi:hypothetical protein